MMIESGGGGPIGRAIDNSTSKSGRRSDTSAASSPRSQASNVPKVRVDTGKKQAQSPRGGNEVGSSGKAEPSSSSSRRGGRKKKNGRMDSRPNNRAGEKKARGGGGGPRTLVLPHSKLTIRCIHDVEKFGSADQMADFLRGMFVSASTGLAEAAVSSPTEYSVVLDEFSLQRCCKKYETSDEKESVEEQREQPQDEQPQDHSVEGKAVVNTENDSPTENTVVTKEDDLSTDKTGVAKENEPYAENVVVTNESETLPSSQEKENIHILITTKTLYLVPPRKSRRRGIITGSIYLVLNPTIKSTPFKKMSNFERSKTVATARLALQSFQTILASNITTTRIILERSANQKTFYTDKHHIHRTPRSSLYEGSIFQTEDYQTFMQQRLQFQEDLKNRPKPQPGGGYLDSVTTTSIISKEDSKEEKKDLPQSKQSVSALVLYLQKKKEMASYKKKSAMKLNASSKSSKRKKKKETKNSGQGANKSKKDFKKKGTSKASSSTAAGNNASNPMAMAPKAILKS